MVRKLYNEYYKKRKRGFTEDEFRKVCVTVAHNNLNELFDYVYTTKEPDYKKYFNYGGLDFKTADDSFEISPSANPNQLQATILKTWLAEKPN